MNKIELVRQSVQQRLSDINDLLAMRLIFTPKQSVVSIDQEILDLYTYPERLETSYRDEWRAIAIKALYQHVFAENEQADQLRLDAYLHWLRDQAIPRCKLEHPKLFDAIAEVQAIQRADNTIRFPGPGRRYRPSDK